MGSWKGEGEENNWGNVKVWRMKAQEERGFQTVFGAQSHRFPFANFVPNNLLHVTAVTCVLICMYVSGENQNNAK